MTGFRILFWRFADYSIVQKYPKRIITTSDTTKLVEFVCMFKFCSKFISKFRGLPSAWNLLHQIIVFLWITSKNNFWNCRCEKDLLIIFFIWTQWRKPGKVSQNLNNLHPNLHTRSVKRKNRFFGCSLKT